MTILELPKPKIWNNFDLNKSRPSFLRIWRSSEITWSGIRWYLVHFWLLWYPIKWSHGVFLPESVAESRYVCHWYYHINMILHIIFDNFIKSMAGIKSRWTFFLFLEYLFLKSNVEILEFLGDNPVRYFTSIGFTSTSHDGFHTLANQMEIFWLQVKCSKFLWGPRIILCHHRCQNVMLVTDLKCWRH